MAAYRLLPECRRREVGSLSVAVIVDVPVSGVLAEGSGLEGLRDPGGKRERRSGVSATARLPQRRHQMQAGIAVKLFRHRQIGQRGIVVRTIPASSPHLGAFHQIAPVVRSSTGPLRN